MTKKELEDGEFRWMEQLALPLKKEDTFKKAQQLVMTTTPSAAAKDLVQMVCEKDPPMETVATSESSTTFGS